MKCPCGKTHGPPRKPGTTIHEEAERLLRMPDGQWRDTFTRGRVGTWGQALPPMSFEWSAGSPQVALDPTEMTLENGVLSGSGRLRLGVDVPAPFLFDDQPVIRARPDWPAQVQIHEEFERFIRGSRGRS